MWPWPLIDQSIKPNIKNQVFDDWTNICVAFLGGTFYHAVLGKKEITGKKRCNLRQYCFYMQLSFNQNCSQSLTIFVFCVGRLIVLQVHQIIYAGSGALNALNLQLLPKVKQKWMKNVTEIKTQEYIRITVNLSQ